MLPCFGTTRLGPPLGVTQHRGPGGHEHGRTTCGMLARIPLKRVSSPGEERTLIASFGDRATEALFHGRSSRSRRIPANMRATALRKLDMVNAARELRDLRVPPGNRLEALKGDREGEHNIRVNDQWRIKLR